MKLFEAIIVTLISFVTTTLKILFPIIIIILLIIFFKLIHRYRKYGRSDFDTFKKRENIKFIDMMICMINEINEFKIIINGDNLYADLIVLSETGIYLIKVMKYQGIITGEKSDAKLKNKIKRKEIEIDNPFYHLENDKNKLLLIDNSLEIKTILVTNSGVNIRINNVLKNQIYNIADFYYMFENDLKNTKIYDKLYLEKLAKLIK